MLNVTSKRPRNPVSLTDRFYKMIKTCFFLKLKDIIMNNIHIL